jgi:hypothetical protein
MYNSVKSFKNAVPEYYPDLVKEQWAKNQEGQKEELIELDHIEMENTD